MLACQSQSVSVRTTMWGLVRAGGAKTPMFALLWPHINFQINHSLWTGNIPAPVLVCGPSSPPPVRWPGRPAPPPTGRQTSSQTTSRTWRADRASLPGTELFCPACQSSWLYLSSSCWSLYKFYKTILDFCTNYLHIVTLSFSLYTILPVLIRKEHFIK